MGIIDLREKNKSKKKTYVVRLSQQRCYEYFVVVNAKDEDEAEDIAWTELSPTKHEPYSIDYGLLEVENVEER